MSHGSVTVSQHEQFQDSEAKAAKWNSAVYDIIYTCVFYCCDMTKCLIFSMENSALSKGTTNKLTSVKKTCYEQSGAVLMKIYIANLP